MENVNRIVVCFFLLLLSIRGWTQEDCASVLKKAQSYYVDGELERIPVLLKSCMESGFYRQEKIEAYKLLISTYLFQDMDNKADSIMLKLLQYEPEVTMNRNEDIEFIKLFETYQTQPSFSLGLTAGMNAPMIQFINTYTTSGYGSLSNIRSSPLPGAEFGLNFGHSLGRELYLKYGANFRKLSYTNVLDLDDSTFTTFEESTLSVDFPISFSISLKTKKNVFKPYFKLGLTPTLLFMDDAYVQKQLESQNIEDISGPKIDMLNERRMFNLISSVSLGVKYKIPRAFISFEVQFNRSLMNQWSGNPRYSVGLLTYNYQYVDQDFRINFFSFSLGYDYLLYKSKKKKKNIRNESIYD